MAIGFGIAGVIFAIIWMSIILFLDVIFAILEKDTLMEILISLFDNLQFCFLFFCIYFAMLSLKTDFFEKYFLYSRYILIIIVVILQILKFFNKRKENNNSDENYRN